MSSLPRSKRKIQCSQQQMCALAPARALFLHPQVTVYSSGSVNRALSGTRNKFTMHQPKFSAEISGAVLCNIWRQK